MIWHRPCKWEGMNKNGYTFLQRLKICLACLGLCAAAVAASGLLRHGIEAGTKRLTAFPAALGPVADSLERLASRPLNR